MRKKLTHEYIENYYLKNNYIINSIYNGTHNKDKLTCPNGHNIEMTFNSFKNNNSRCNKCNLTNKKYSHEVIYNYYKENNYIMKSIYKNSLTKDELICPNGHNIKISFNNFKSKNRRCGICYHENNSGINHYNYNANREELKLNDKLRKKHKNNWIIKHMKEDPNYEKFLLNPNNYVIDHIIPVSLFCKLTVEYNLNESQIRKIINQRDNLQLLTIKENDKKYINGSSLFEATNYLVNNSIPFETFLEKSGR